MVLSGDLVEPGQRWPTIP